jgi:hypothetical protein
MVYEVKIKKSDIKKINKQLSQSLVNYRNFTTYMAADIPIGALCLDETTQKILDDNGITRVYDLFGRDFTEIKGIGKVRARHLTARLNEFLSIG